MKIDISEIDLGLLLKFRTLDSNKSQHQDANSKRCCTLLQNMLSAPYQDLEQALASVMT